MRVWVRVCLITFLWIEIAKNKLKLKKRNFLIHGIVLCEKKYNYLDQFDFVVMI